MTLKMSDGLPVLFEKYQNYFESSNTDVRYV